MNIKQQKQQYYDDSRTSQPHHSVLYLTNCSCLIKIQVMNWIRIFTFCVSAYVLLDKEFMRACTRYRECALHKLFKFQMLSQLWVYTEH